MSNVLGLETQNYAAVIPGGFPERVESDRIVNTNDGKIDAALGILTSSFCSTFFVSGAISECIMKTVGADISNLSRTFRHYKVMSATSGSGGVTTLDVQLSSSAGWTSIFSNDRLRPHLSSSDQVMINSGSTFSTATWSADQALRVTVKEAAGSSGANGQVGVTLVLFWKPASLA